MNWIDAHCHLTDERIAADLPELVAECEARGIKRWVLAGVSPEDWRLQRGLVAKLGTKVVPCFGLHPWWVCDHSADEMRAALGTLKTELTGAPLLGETGLDYFSGRGEADKADRQMEAFLAQLEMAEAAKKPVVLHIVRAHENALRVLSRFAPLKGWVHSFSGSAEQARQYLALGLMISLGGSTTRVPEAKLKKILEAIPEDGLLIETDAPDQAPRFPDGTEKLPFIKVDPSMPKPSTLNRPVNLIAIAEYLAGFCGKKGSLLLDKSRENLERVIGK